MFGRIGRSVLGLLALVAASASAPAATAATTEYTVVNASATSFPLTAAGSSVSQTVQIQVNAAVTISSVAIAPSVNGHQEFALGAVTGCTVDGSAATAAGATCSIPVTFTPTYSGLRQQTIAITDSTGVVTSIGLTGLASGPQGILLPGNVTTLGGASGGYYYSGDNGPVASARFSAPYNIAVDAMNNLYIADEVSGNVRVVYQAGAALACLIEIEQPTLFGLATGATSCAGATSAPTAGDVYTLGGDPTPYTSSTSTHLKGSDDNRIATTLTATTSPLNSPAGIAVDAYGNILIGDYNAYKLRVIYTGGASMACLIEIENPTLFGLAKGATACTAATSSPKVGYIYTLLGGTGTSTPGASGDGALANSAIMTYAAAVAVSTSGDIFLVDDSTNAARTSRIRVIYNGGAAAAALITAENPTVTAPVVGYVYKIAGGVFASSGDGALAASGGILYARGLVLTPDGDLVFTDQSTTSGSQVAKVRVVYGGGSRMASLIALENSGIVPQLGYMYTIGGSSTTGASGIGYSGDGGLASAALLTNPYSLTMDPAGDIYVSDYGKYDLRKISGYDGKISTYAGIGTQAVVSGNALTTAALWDPYGMAWGAGGTLFFTDPGVYRLREISSTANAIAFTNAAPVGGQSETEVVYETNTGNTALTFTAITPSVNFAVVASGSSAYSDCGASTVLQPGQTCAIGVILSPSTGGALTGTLTVYNNSLNIANNSQNVALSGTAAIQTATALTTSSASADLNTNLTFNATVTVVSGQNTTGAAALAGNVTFTAGATTLGTAAIDPTSGIATLQYSTLAAGSYTVKATFTPTASGYASSSASVAQVIVAPAFTASTSTPGLSVVTGQSVTAALSLVTVGGYTGNVSVSCATPLPADVTCAFSPASVAVKADGATSVTLTIGTSGASTAMLAHTGAVTLAGSFGAMLLLYRRRRRLAGVLALMLALTVSIGLAGCGSATNSAARGTFNVNAVFTDGVTSITVPVTVSVVGK
ncbi:Ig-like domain (group 3) [Granulicella rosea]|uniref:Ig-like domain (Group 3) n=2 Tax=Granulicella rosea TaxID=474952 RepID=A0A239LWE9_9BACT|nr:Ig-like domain (group 3) [Granulicella rosea]